MTYYHKVFNIYIWPHFIFLYIFVFIMWLSLIDIHRLITKNAVDNHDNVVTLVIDGQPSLHKCYGSSPEYYRNLIQKILSNYWLLKSIFMWAWLNLKFIITNLTNSFITRKLLCIFIVYKYRCYRNIYCPLLTTCIYTTGNCINQLTKFIYFIYLRI